MFVAIQLRGNSGTVLSMDVVDMHGCSSLPFVLRLHAAAGHYIFGVRTQCWISELPYCR